VTSLSPSPVVPRPRPRPRPRRHALVDLAALAGVLGALAVGWTTWPSGIPV